MQQKRVSTEGGNILLLRPGLNEMEVKEEGDKRHQGLGTLGSQSRLEKGSRLLS